MKVEDFEALQALHSPDLYSVTQSGFGAWLQDCQRQRIISTKEMILIREQFKSGRGQLRWKGFRYADLGLL